MDTRLLRGSLLGWAGRFLFGFILTAVVGVAQASHFRFGQLSWQPRPDLSPTTAAFTLVAAFRRCGYSGSGSDGCPVINDEITEDVGDTTLIFGDGASAGGPLGPLRFRVTAFDPSADWIVAVALDPNTNSETILHNYPSARNNGASWVAAIDSCCRISSLSNYGNGRYRVETYVDLADGVTPPNVPPSTNLPPIVNCPANGLCRFLVPAADADPGSTLAFRNSNSAEDGGLIHPPGLNVAASTGMVEWDTTSLAVGSLWANQVVIEDYVGGEFRTKVAVDFLIRLVPDGVPPVLGDDQDPAHVPVCNATVPAEAGGLVSFTIDAADADSSDVVTLNSSNFPGAASMTPSLPTSGNPVSSIFRWTPTVADIGVRVLHFTATDSGGLQVSCPVTIDVRAGNAVRPIVFVPGILGTELVGGGEIFWPDLVGWNADDKFRQLALDSGRSLLPGNIIGQVIPGVESTEVYSEWASFLDSISLSGFLWAPVPYDWRQSPELQSSRVADRIVQAYNRSNRKVLVVSHSMGNFLVKHALATYPSLADMVDAVAFVAAPQWGSTKMLQVALHGDHEIATLSGISRGDIRATVNRMPGAYMNAPSAAYFSTMQDNVPAPIQFADGRCNDQNAILTANFRRLCYHFGGRVDTFQKLTAFLSDRASRFEFVPTSLREDMNRPALLDGAIFQHTSELHERLDEVAGWKPASVKLYQIVGIDERTTCGITYSEADVNANPFSTTIDIRPEPIMCPPDVTGEGDKTVMWRSADASAQTSPADRTYYVDLSSGGCLSQHGDFMEMDSVQRQLLQIAQGNDDVVSGSQCAIRAAPNSTPSGGYLQISIFSPLSVRVTDSDLRMTGDGPAGLPVEEIPGSAYETIGESRHIIVNFGQSYSLGLDGTADGIAGLRVSAFDGNAVRQQDLYYVTFPVIRGMKVDLNFNGLGDFAELPVDVDGNGSIDLELIPKAKLDPSDALGMLRVLVEESVQHKGARVSMLAIIANAEKALSREKYRQAAASMKVLRTLIARKKPEAFEGTAKTSALTLIGFVEEATVLSPKKEDDR